MKFPKLSIGLSFTGMLVVVLAYQNCSRTHFSGDLEGAQLKAVAVDDGSRSTGDDGQTSGGDVPPRSGPPDKSSPPGKDNPPHKGEDTSGLVECQMLHPNKKVVLNYDLLVQPGNSSTVRVCMSENACLKLINEFAIKHSCSLEASAPSSAADAQRQCTEIFPGSKGTCHNATVVSDAQVSELLKKLSP